MKYLQAARYRCDIICDIFLEHTAHYYVVHGFVLQSESIVQDQTQQGNINENSNTNSIHADQRRNNRNTANATTTTTTSNTTKSNTDIKDTITATTTSTRSSSTSTKNNTTPTTYDQQQQQQQHDNNLHQHQHQQDNNLHRHQHKHQHQHNQIQHNPHNPHHRHVKMATAPTTVQDFATELAGRDNWLCVIYTKGCSEDANLEELCLEIGDLHQTGGLCIVANTDDPDNMAILNSTVEVANTYNAPVFSISLGEEELPRGAVRSADHSQVSISAGGEGGEDQYEFVTEVLTEILKILRRRRGRVD